MGSQPMTNERAEVPGLLPCPFCGGTPRICTDTDIDGCYWAKVVCRCGVSTRGKWASSSENTCPVFYAEVRSEWNTRERPGPAGGDALDAARYRWLRRKVSAHGVIDGWTFAFPTHLTLPAPSSAIRDPAGGLDAAIDAALSEPKT